MHYLTVKCSVCQQKIRKELRRINEARKFGWQFYCSNDCLTKSRHTRKEINCSNPNCSSTLWRTTKHIHKQKNHFCSHSCSATFSNPRRIIKRYQVIDGEKVEKTQKYKKYCANKNCGRLIPERNTYCSNKCQQVIQKISKDAYAKRALYAIRTFNNQHGRIPFKNELWSAYKPARKAFGTWNNAIKAAGFKPNPVRFANKYIAEDGHACDSMAEKIIDDWLYKKGVPHERSVPYNKNGMTADFKIGDVLIEFFGLSGQHIDYDGLVEEKKKLWKKKSIKAIALYPKDVPNRLPQLLASILPS